MTTGARRGEICALRWDGIDFAGRTLTIKASIAQDGARTWEKGTKTHQQRRIALDDESIALLRNYRAWCEQLASDAGVMVAENGGVFYDTPRPLHVNQTRHRQPTLPANVRQTRLAHEHPPAAPLLRHRTHLGRRRRPHRSRPPRPRRRRATTLRVHSAWVSEADQRAATNLAIRMPRPPITLNADGIAEPVADDEDEPNSPYKRTVADLRGAINCGAIRPGDQLPTAADLAHSYHVAISTAHRAITDLRDAGLIIVSRGRRAVCHNRQQATAVRPTVHM